MILMNIHLFLIMLLYLTEVMKTQQSQYLSYNLLKMHVTLKWVVITRLGSIKQDKPLDGLVFLRMCMTTTLHIILMMKGWMQHIYMNIHEQTLEEQ